MFNRSDAFLPPLPSFPQAVTPPAVDPDEGTQAAYCVAEEWLPVIRAALQALTLPTTWAGSDADVQEAQQRAMLLLDLFNEACSTGGDCPFDLRYDDATDAVQVSVDGGETWIDAPEFDPRQVNAFSPPDTADPRCDGAARMVAMLQGAVTALIDGVDNADPATTLADTVLEFLYWIPGVDLLVALLVVILQALIALGASTLHTAFDSFDWNALTCELYCYVGDDGYITDVQLSAWYAYIAANYSATQNTVLSALIGFVGRGGMNDAAALREDEGDCESCTSCAWDIHVALDWAWGIGTYESAPGSGCAIGSYAPQGHLGELSGYAAWICDKTLGDNANRLGRNFLFTLPEGSKLEYVYLYFYRTSGNTDGFVKEVRIDTYRGCVSGAFHNSPVVYDVRSQNFIGGTHQLKVGIGTSVASDATTFYVTTLRLIGTGALPNIPTQ